MKYKNQNGALLINILVSFGIIALLSTIAIPNIKKYQPNLKLNGAGRDLTSDLRYAQQLTITEQIVYTVEFDISNNEYEIIKNTATPEVIKSVEFPVEVKFQQITGLTDNKVVFNSYGGVSESGTIFLVNTTLKEATIEIKPSGYIQLNQ